MQRCQAVVLSRPPDAGKLLAGSLPPSTGDCAIWCRKAVSFALAESVPGVLAAVFGASAESRLLKALRSGEAAGAGAAGGGAAKAAAEAVPVPVGATVGKALADGVAAAPAGAAGAAGAVPRLWASASSRCASSP